MRFLFAWVLVFYSCGVRANSPVDVQGFLNLVLEKGAVKKELDLKASLDFLSDETYYNPWGTKIETSLSKTSETEEGFSSQIPSNSYFSLPFEFDLEQNSPYGVSLQGRYSRILNEPTAQNFIEKERYGADLSVSLYQDFLGKKSRWLSRKNNQTIKSLYKEKEKLDNLVKVGEVLLNFLSIREKLKVVSQSLKGTEKLKNKVKRAYKNRALSKDDRVSFDLDQLDLISKKLNFERQLRSEGLKLENVSGLDLGGLDFKKLNVFSIQDFSRFDGRKVSLEEKLGQFKLEQAETKIIQDNLNTQHDIELYGGYSISELTNRTIGVQSGTTETLNIGVRLNWTFGDGYLKRKRKFNKINRDLKRQELVRIHRERRNDQRQLLEQFKIVQESRKQVLEGVKESSYLERRSIEQFARGQINLNIFLSRRNQVLNLKQSEIDTRKELNTIGIKLLSLGVLSVSDFLQGVKL